MVQTFAPTSDAEVVEAVRWALAEHRTLAVCGTGTKLGWGRPVAADAQLTLKGFGGIDSYEPEELVLSARAGTPMAELQQRLAQQGQQFAFEPPDFGPLYGFSAGLGTLGGAIACNLAGPRRIAAGAARDHVLGFHGVNGLGESFKAGGRVVKNVTGFDLSKLLSGSFGTLAVMTQITLKVLPAPEDARTILVSGPDAAAAIDIMGMALRSPHEVSGAAYLPAKIAARSRISSVSLSGTGIVAVRMEGATPSVVARAEGLRQLLAGYGEIGDCGGSDSRLLWSEIRDVASYLSDARRAVWQISVPPAAGARLASLIATADDDLFMDWGGGRIWFACAGDPAASVQRVRSGVAAVGGHATLMRAEESARPHLAVFQPPSRVEASLVARLKDNFDPHRILNPGRMYEGI